MQRVMQVILKRKTHQTILKAKRTFCFSRGQKFVLFFWFVLQRQYFEPNLKCSIFTQPRYYSFDHHVEYWEDEQDEDEEDEAEMKMMSKLMMNPLSP